MRKDILKIFAISLSMITSCVAMADAPRYSPYNSSMASNYAYQWALSKNPQYLIFQQIHYRVVTVQTSLVRRYIQAVGNILLVEMTKVQILGMLRGIMPKEHSLIPKLGQRLLGFIDVS